MLSKNAKNVFRWGLMTITTVGYDLNPKTLLGKLIGNSYDLLCINMAVLSDSIN